MKRLKIRCLGPGKEHHFASSDPKRNRVCRACKAKLERAHTYMPVEYQVNLESRINRKGVEL